jgi:hypothetical protein
MASAIPSIILGRIHGRVGNLVFRSHGGRTIVSQRPAPRRDRPTERQLAQRLRFRAAAHYACSALANPAGLAFYAATARQRNLSPKSAAISDYLNAPVIHDIAFALYQGHAEDEIIIHATDDTEVVSVTVAIKDMTGRELERGPARLWDGAWIYDATTTAPAGHPLTIQVTAMDRPGNEVTRSTPWVPDQESTALPSNSCMASPPMHSTLRLIT